MAKDRAKNSKRVYKPRPTINDLAKMRAEDEMNSGKDDGSVEYDKRYADYQIDDGKR
jgi:hypothetical protein